MADHAVESQLTEKDHELEELHRQLQEAQDMERACKQNTAQHGLYPLFIMLTVDALVVFNRQYLPSSQSQTTPLSSQSQMTPPSQVQRQPLTEVAFPTNAQDDDESDIDEDENIDPSLCTLTPMQVDKTIMKDLESCRQLKEPLKQRLGFENNKWGYDDFRVYHFHSKLTIDFCTRTPEEA